MTQALFYKPSYDHLKDRINRVAPDLEIALYDQGCFYLHGKQVALDDLKPEYFWIHSELFRSPLMRDYFDIALELPSAEWMHTVNTGLDFLPYDALLKKGVKISNNHSQSIIIAEYVLGQVFSHFQNIADFRAKQKEKVWKFRPSREINNTEWLIIGFGHIGQTLAKPLKALGASVTAVRRSPETEGLADKVLSLDEIDQALPNADVVVLACNSNTQTKNLVNKDFLKHMSSNSILVNIARGDLVVEEDLKEALDNGFPELAILDVFNQEPLPEDSWLWHHPKVALSPHCSNASLGTRTRSEDLFIENLRRIVQGEPLLNEVNERDIF